jgi:hypothetical protein
MRATPMGSGWQANAVSRFKVVRKPPLLAGGGHGLWVVVSHRLTTLGFYNYFFKISLIFLLFWL